MPLGSAPPAEDASTPSLVWTRPATTRRAAPTREAIRRYHHDLIATGEFPMLSAMSPLE